MQKISSNKIASIINDLPTSKSYANRALVYSYLKRLKNNIHSLPISDDVVNTKNALDNLTKNEVFLGEGGTTIRFMLPLFANKTTATKIIVDEKFKQRPMTDLFLALKNLGANITFSNETNHLCTISGPLKINEIIEIDCEKTTQFASALMMIAPFINLNLKLRNLNSSLKYVEMTNKVMQSLDEKENFTVPVDLSSASYFIAYGVLNQDILFPQIIQRDAAQADDAFFDILTKINANFYFSSKGLVIKKSSSLKPIAFDVSNCIDLTMTLIYMCLFIDGNHELSGIRNLKFKETNRIEGIESILKQINAEYEVSEDIIKIKGRVFHKKLKIEPLKDHRLVMLASLILKQFGQGEVSNFEYVSKSFPNFFELL